MSSQKQPEAPGRQEREPERTTGRTGEGASSLLAYLVRLHKLSRVDAMANGHERRQHKDADEAARE